MTKVVLAFVLGSALAGGVTAVKAANDKAAAMTAQETRMFELMCERAKEAHVAQSAEHAKFLLGRLKNRNFSGPWSREDAEKAARLDRDGDAMHAIVRVFCVTSPPSASAAR